VTDDATRRDNVIDEGDAPEYLIVGTVTRDVIADGYVAGGTVTYAGRTALALGARVAAVTSVGPDIDLATLLPGVPTSIRDAPITTTFENVYRDGRRTQWLRSVAAILDLSLIPDSWRSARIAHLAPLVNDVGLDIVEGLRHSGLLGITPQGWLRAWDETGLVRRSTLRQPETTFGRFDAVVLSEEDVERDWTSIERWATVTKLLVATQGERGCTVFENRRRWQVPAFPVVEVDATGAGDVFAAAFLIRMLESGDPIVAARYANCVASFVVEDLGPGSVPSESDIERRLRQVVSLPVVAE
jgi:sugar/nucleoside kinase (ribokinase family)